MSEPSQPPTTTHPAAAPPIRPRPLIAYVHLVLLAFLAQWFCLAYYWLQRPSIWVEDAIDVNTLFQQGCLIVSWTLTALFNIRISLLTELPWLRWMQIVMLVILAVSVVLTVFRAPF